MSLDKMSLDGIRGLLDSPREMRQYCLDNDLDVLDTIDAAESIINEQASGPVMKPSKKRTAKKVTTRKTGRKRVTRKKSVKSVASPTVGLVIDSQKKFKRPEIVVDSVLEEFQPIRERTYTIDDIANRVSLDLRNNRLEIADVCSLEDFIANRLYGAVMDGVTEKRHIKKGEIARKLNVLLDRNSKNLIKGILTPHYVEQNYAFNLGQVHFKDRLTGEIYPHPNVGGVSNWVDTEKDGVRIALINNSLEHIVKLIEDDHSERFFELEDISEEIQVVTNDVELSKRKMKEFEKAKVQEVFILRGSSYSMDQYSKKILGGGAKSNKMHGREIDERSYRERDDNKNEIIVRFNRSTVANSDIRSFKSKTDIFVNTERSQGRRIEFESNPANIDKKMARVKSRLQELTRKQKRLISKGKNLQADIDIGPRLNYLGLEGPNFNSFLSLYRSFSEHKVLVDGIFVENEPRNYNLMNSLMSSDIFGDVFEYSEVTFGDINDWILLDFNTDDRVKLGKRSNRNGSLTVNFLNEKMDLDRYQRAIDDINADASVSDVCKNYNISKSFSKALTERIDHKFDVVFLDYVGRLTEKKSMAIESLLERRLSDKAIFATTINIAGHVNPKSEVGAVEEIGNNLFDKMVDDIDEYGYDCPDVISMEYNAEITNKHHMVFQLYCLERRK